ncbi:DUF2590 family protein [Algicola sagamiensis]|uniref:DUF2590 family protein n=1 Tax=Algicola sagamiensis TaxID=163869 RepID=UPI000376F71C|nr:DUF2590 family protein [Algicola sagamiensis]
MNQVHVDLLVNDGDFVLNDALSPAQVNKAQTISQDIKHRILESGLLVRLVKLRNQNGIAPILTEIELEVEKDDRVIPGTIEVFYNADMTLSILAQTRDYGGQDAA